MHFKTAEGFYRFTLQMQGDFRSQDAGRDALRMHPARAILLPWGDATTIPGPCDDRHVQELIFCLRKGSGDLAVQKLQEIVPEYRPNRPSPKARVRVHPSATPADAPA